MTYDLGVRLAAEFIGRRYGSVRERFRCQR